MFLKSDATPNELYVEQPPPPASANASVFNGPDEYIEVSGWGGESGGVMDFTHDWSMAVTVQVQGQGVQGSSMITFCLGTNSFNVKVQGIPAYNYIFVGEGGLY